MGAGDVGADNQKVWAAVAKGHAVRRALTACAGDDRAAATHLAHACGGGGDNGWFGCHRNDGRVSDGDDAARHRGGGRRSRCRGGDGGGGGGGWKGCGRGFGGLDAGRGCNGGVATAGQRKQHDGGQGGSSCHCHISRGLWWGGRQCEFVCGAEVVDDDE